MPYVTYALYNYVPLMFDIDLVFDIDPVVPFSYCQAWLNPRYNYVGYIIPFGKNHTFNHVPCPWAW